VTIRRIAVYNVREGIQKGCLTYITFGDGPPLIVFPGLGPSNANPTGMLLRFEMGWLSPLARAFRVYRLNRKVGLAPATTMADLASHYATAIEDSFEGAVNILGFSTGGSIAQQFAADRPDLVCSLVLAGTACRLGPVARDAQRRHAHFAASGRYRRSLAALAPTITGSALGQRLAGAAMWLAAPLGGMGPYWDPSDMIVTVEAEDAFDVSERLGEIRAPTLVIGGERDPVYSRGLFEETTRGIPDARLLIYKGRGHGGTVTDRRFARDVKTFLVGVGRHAKTLRNSNT
jgi:pimeloyl-ACP methyl ester carboxylesterase